MSEPHAGVRLDRWLWAARFFKTRAQAKQAIEGGKVRLCGGRAKASRPVNVGDALSITRGDDCTDVRVVELSEQRHSAPLAQRLYEETEQSKARRTANAERRRLERAAFTAPATRPSKRDRRALTELKYEQGE